MDKYEFRLRVQEIDKLIDKQKYAEAVRLADTIDWRKIKKTGTLIKIAELYKINKRFEECKDLLEIAYDRNPYNKRVVYDLSEVCLEFGDIVNAVEYFKEFAQLAPNDIEIYTLKYRLLDANNVGAEEKIDLLEELRSKTRIGIAEWEYELAYLYHRSGQATKCVEICDEIVLWNNDGPFVTKAMELKMLHEPLTPQQQYKYDHRNDEKYKIAADANNRRKAKETEELDFRVKTIDMSNKFNTINLQAELAQNVSEYLDNTNSFAQNLGNDMDMQEIAYQTSGNMQGGMQYANTAELNAPYSSPNMYENSNMYENGVIDDRTRVMSAPGIPLEGEGTIPVSEIGQETKIFSPVNNAQGVQNQGNYADNNIVYDEAPKTPSGWVSSSDFINEPRTYSSQRNIYTDNQNANAVTDDNASNADSQEVFFADKTSDIRFEIPTPKPADSAVSPEMAAFREQYARGMEQQSQSMNTAVSDMEEICIDPDTGEIKTVEVNNMVNAMEASNSEPVNEYNNPVMPNAVNPAALTNATNTSPNAVNPAALTNATNTSPNAVNPAALTNATNTSPNVVMPKTNNSNLGQYLSQGSDGQINMAFDNQQKIIEKQITGQMSIEDILSNWNQSKEHRNDVLYDDVNKRVLESTGKIFDRANLDKQNSILNDIGKNKRVSMVNPTENITTTSEEAVRIDTAVIAGIIEEEEKNLNTVIPMPGENAPVEITKGNAEEFKNEEASVDVEAVATVDEAEVIKEQTETADEIAQNTEAAQSENVQAQHEDKEQPANQDQSTTGATAQAVEAVLDADEESADETEATMAREAVVQAIEASEEAEVVEEEALNEENTNAVEEEALNEENTNAVRNQEGKYYGQVTDVIPGSIWKEVDGSKTAQTSDNEITEINESIEAMEAAEREPSEVLSADDMNFNEQGVDGNTDYVEENEEPREAVNEGAYVAQNEEAQYDENAQVTRRKLTKEDKKLFGKFLYSKKMKEQIIDAIDAISMAAYTGNLIVTSETSETGVKLAKAAIKYVQQSDANFSGDVARVSADNLNNKSIAAVMDKIRNGALIIEGAGDMSDATINEMTASLNREDCGAIVVLVDRKGKIKRLIDKAPMLVEMFNARVDIISMSTDTLVEYGIKYALNEGFSVDEMASLAFYKRIQDMQVGNHMVTLAEVKEIIDNAIKKSSKKNLGSIARKLTGKKYDNDDRVILREKDFDK